MKSKDKAGAYGLPDHAVDARPRRKRWPHVLVTGLILAAGGQMLTQEMAGMVQFDPRLGEAALAQYYWPCGPGSDGKTGSRTCWVPSSIDIWR